MRIYSASQLKMVMRCPLQAKFSYVDRIGSAQSGAATYGTIMHYVTEQYDRGMTLKEATALFLQLWAEPERLGVKPDYWPYRTSFESYKKRGLAAIQSYANLNMWGRPQIIAHEYPFLVPFGDHEIRGVIDRLELRTTGNKKKILTVTDKKTAAKKPSKYDLRTDIQFTIYLMALRQKQFWTGVPDSGTYLGFENGEELYEVFQTYDHAGVYLMIGDPCTELDVGERTDDDFKQLYRLISEVSRAYESNVFIPRIGTDTCGNCVDVETEILTKRGWLKWDEVKPYHDEALSISPISLKSEWKVISRVYAEVVDQREMLQIEGQNHSSLTTLDHKWPVLFRQEGLDSFRFVASQDLSSTCRIPVAALCDDLPSLPTHEDDLVELAAWYWTEGLDRSRYTPGSGVEIGQSITANPDNWQRIFHLLERMFGPPATGHRRSSTSSAASGATRTPPEAEGLGFKRSVVTRRMASSMRALRLTGAYYSDIADRFGVSYGTAYKYCNQAELGFLDDPPHWWAGEDRFFLSGWAVDSCHLRDLVISDEKVPTMDFLLSLTSDQLELFIQVSILGDGDATGRMHQNLGDAMDMYQIALALSGRSTSVRASSVKRAGWASDRKRKVFNPIAASMRLQKRTGESNVHYVRYSGVIWCPTVEDNHTFLCRRRGHSYFTGNCDYYDVCGLELPKPDLDAEERRRMRVV